MDQIYPNSGAKSPNESREQKKIELKGFSALRRSGWRSHAPGPGEPDSLHAPRPSPSERSCAGRPLDVSLEKGERDITSKPTDGSGVNPGAFDQLESIAPANLVDLPTT